MEEGDAYGVESVSLYQGYRRRLVSLSEQTRLRSHPGAGPEAGFFAGPSGPPGGWKDHRSHPAGCGRLVNGSDNRSARLGDWTWNLCGRHCDCQPRTPGARSLQSAHSSRRWCHSCDDRGGSMQPEPGGLVCDQRKQHPGRRSLGKCQLSRSINGQISPSEAVSPRIPCHTCRACSIRTSVS